MNCRKWLLIGLMMMFIIGYTTPTPIISHDETPMGDVLAYSIYEGLVRAGISPNIVLYNPATGEERVFPTNQKGSYFFGLSRKGIIAYLSSDGEDYDVYLIDTNSDDISPVNITQSPDIRDFDFRWSPDGRYLVFQSHDGDNRILYVWDTDKQMKITLYGLSNMQEPYSFAWSPDGQYLAFGLYQQDLTRLLYVWDGESVINITPADIITTPTHYGFAWSFDGRLAMQVTIFNDNLSMSEIYIWDDDTIMSLTQDWQQVYQLGPWNTQGELVYAICSVEYECDILIWDGVSFRDGLPDKSTFTKIPQPIRVAFNWLWDIENRLMFTDANEFGREEIYRWDRENVVNMSQNPDNHNGGPYLSHDGRWAFVTFFSSEQLIYVRDSENNTLLVSSGQYTPAWSSDGYLMFCKPNWVVNLWDGQQIIEVTKGGDIWAQWQQSGKYIFCSSG